MKNGRYILLLVCSLCLTFVMGVFVGRNLTEDYAKLPEDSESEVIAAATVQKDYKLDINSATKTQLMELPGIGQMLAERIIAYRTENGPFSTIEDLMNVDGIGEKKLQEIETLIKVGG